MHAPKTLQIYKTATSIQVECKEDGTLPNGISLGPHMRTFYEYKYDRRMSRFVPAYKYIFYDRIKKKLYMPVAFLPDLLDWIGTYPYEIIDTPPIPSIHADFSLADGIELRGQQEDLVSFLANPKERYRALSASTGVGKLNPHSTKIKVPGGWTTMGEIQVGDKATMPDGSVAEVIGKYPQGKKPIWIVHFEDGRKSECGGEHLWKIHLNGTKPHERVVTSTENIFKLIHIDHRIISIDLVSEESPEAAPHIELPNAPYEVGKALLKNPGSRIPDIYYDASWKQRKELLQGILENNVISSEVTIGCDTVLVREVGYATEGYYEGGKHKIVVDTMELRDDILKLVWSLGGKTHDYYKNGKFKVDIDTSPTRLRIVHVEKPIARQEECSCIMVDHPDHLYIVDDYIVTHNTVCAIAASSRLKKPALIVTSGLLAQWWKEIISKSTLKKHELWFIRGVDSIKKLLDAKPGYKPKMIIASTRTLFSYVTRQKLPYTEMTPYSEMIERFGIGVKIIDEAHMNFHANLTIDLLSNIEHNLYLSATFERNNRDGARIFNRVFPEDVKYGDHLLKKYSKAYMVGYQLGREIPPNRYTTKEGYNHALYEITLGRDKNLRYEFYHVVINNAMDQFFLPNRKPGQKCLIICMTTGTMKGIVTHLKYKYPNLKAIPFSGDDPDDIITPDIDVVVSTIKKSGTGRDIKNLKVCVNVVSFRSSPLTKQLFGRLRELPGEETIFVDYFNKDVERHKDHAETRRQIYGGVATSVEVW